MSVALWGVGVSEGCGILWRQAFRILDILQALIEDLEDAWVEILYSL